MPGNGNPQVPLREPKFCPQLLRSNPTGLLSIGQPSHHPAQPDTKPIPLDPHPTNMDELLACCIIGKIWGDPIPLPAIIHKTKKDWYFVKGQVDYIDAGNDCIMIRFANSEDRLLVYDQRPWHVNGLKFVLQK